MAASQMDEAQPDEALAEEPQADASGEMEVMADASGEVEAMADASGEMAAMADEPGEGPALTQEQPDPFAEMAFGAAGMPAQVQGAPAHRRATSDVSPLWSLAVGVPLYAVVMIVAQVLPPAISTLLLERGFIPHVIMLLSCWALAILALKVVALVRQRRAFGYELLPPEGAAIGPHNVGEVTDHVQDLQATRRQPSLLLERVLRILDHYAARGDTAETSAINTADADADAAAVASSFSLIKVLIWAIPILGFIGTVIGIGTAVGGFSQSLDGAEQLETIKSSLGEVTSGLAVAFDTTLVALVMSILLMLPTSWIQKAEEKLAGDIDDYCVTQLMRRLSSGEEAAVAGDNSQLLARLPELIAAAMSQALAVPLRKMVEANSALVSQLNQSQHAVREQLSQSMAASQQLAAGTVAAAEQLETSAAAAAERLESSTTSALKELQQSTATAAEQLLASNTALAKSSAGLERQLAGYAKASETLGPAVTEAAAELRQAGQEAQRAQRMLEQGQQQLCRELGASRQLLSLLAAGMGALGQDGPLVAPLADAHGSNGAAHQQHGANGAAAQ